MAEKRQCTEVEIKFDLMTALLMLLSCIKVSVPEGLHHSSHPEEVLRLATEVIVTSINEMVSGLNKDKELQATANAALISGSDLHLLADPKYMPEDSKEVIH